MAHSSEELAAVVVDHLADILAGTCSITVELITSHEGDRSMAEILAGLRLLYDDLKLRESQVVGVEVLTEALDKLSTKNDELEQSRAALAALTSELSTPIIKLWEGVLMTPLVGTIDAVRARQIMERLLPAVSSDRASYVVVDLTGVKAIDAGTVDHFLQIAGAVRLLGAEIIFAGIQPEVSVALVSLGADLSAFTATRDVKDALARCMRRVQ
jgi:anti-anti-sigma regulatory factor